MHVLAELVRSDRQHLAYIYYPEICDVTAMNSEQMWLKMSLIDRAMLF